MDHRLLRPGPLTGLTLALAGTLLFAPAAAETALSSAAQTMPARHQAQQAAAPGTAGQDVSVHGAQLEKGGVPFRPRGVQIVGLVAPKGSLTGVYAKAHRHFGAGELSKAAGDHADTIRFQVSEFGLDPRDSLYSPAYVQEVESAVKTARTDRFTVIVSVQAEPPAGKPTRCPLPDEGTLRVWNKLAPAFAADRGVLFELYNEPSLQPSQRNWTLWRDGGQVTGTNGSCTAVGMQTLVASIRSGKASNVIVVPGLKLEQTISGMPALTDPASPSDPQLAYGIHYPSLSGGSTLWDKEFGAASRHVPVIVSEWNASGTSENCQPAWPAEAPGLLNYLAGKDIGIVGFAFDYPKTIIETWPAYTPTSYHDFACHAPGVPGRGGPGHLLFSRYAAQGAAR